jgi:hypothetical protein
LYKLVRLDVPSSCRVRRFPLQNCCCRQTPLVHLLGVVLDHVAGLAGDRGCLGVGASGLKEEDDGGLAQAVKNETAAAQLDHDWPVEFV